MADEIKDIPPKVQMIKGRLKVTVLESTVPEWEKKGFTVAKDSVPKQV